MSSLYIRVAATEIATKTNSHENTNTSRFRRFCCCAAKATSSRSLMCICDRESRSPEPFVHCSLASSSETARLPLRRSRAEGHRLQRELHQADRCLHSVVIVKEPQVTYGSCSQIMSYIFNMLICVGMILLNNLLQYFLFIAIIDLSRTCDTAIILICYA
jgi:hypothetical protein